MAFFEELFVLFLIGNSITALANKHGGTFINSYNYAYDGNGNQVAKLDIGGTTTYTYDVLNRLASVTEPGGKVTEYAFDEAGNRETQEVTDGTDISLTTYTYNAQNQLLYATEAAGSASTSTVFFYDHNGNTISKHEETIDTSAGSLELSLTIPGSGQKAYTANTYDVFNQLISSKDQDSTSTYKYNGDGLRVGKSVTENGTTTVTQFIYEYDKVVLELDGNGSQTAYNVYGNDMLLSRTSGGTTLYYLYNGHGDVVNIADATGTVVMTYDYDAFGNVTVATGSVANSYLYAGYQFDDETGMYYLNSRYYDPIVARFISADSYLGQAGDPLSLNLYTYCCNEPMMNYDPSGHVVTDWDLEHLTSDQIALLRNYTDLYNKYSGMNTDGSYNDVLQNIANAAAALRASAGYTTNSDGTVAGSTNVYTSYNSDAAALAAALAAQNGTSYTSRLQAEAEDRPVERRVLEI